MIIGKKDRERMVRLRWENLRLQVLDQIRQVEGERLLQYGALVAISHVQEQDMAPILAQAQGHLSRFSYEVLEAFVAGLT